MVGCLFGDGFERDLLGLIRVSHQPSVKSLQFISSCDEFQTGFAPCQPFPPPKTCLWSPYIPPSLAFLPCVSLPHIINTPQLLCPPPHTPTLHPLSTPLGPLTSKACQLNMSLIRAGGARSLGVGEYFSIAIYPYKGIRHTIRQSKKALRSHTHIHSGLL